ncbi:hypothetical protein BDM02DRAFT_2359721 [Thelephora ganbajun]|uniref:Uncharacterized protein n=1 Tax=Thelephora ganbajun TaxID=370292 RepID=A0ACB6ZEX7_THEGA|nr:hypothetical protein BDM02DRAFT_2359721 [Thelephora ganbajun]
MSQARTETFKPPLQGNACLSPGTPPSSACIRPFPGSFPPELSDAVIDHLHGDTNSLRACALTSSSWLSTSRYHLFNDVVLENEVSVLRWAQAFPTPSDIPSYVGNLHVNCVSLLDDISNVVLDLSTFTRLKGLFIGGSEVTPARYRRLNENCFQRIVLLPSTILRNFPRLDNLHLKCFAALASGDAEVSKTETSPSFRGTLTLVSHLNYRPLITNLLAFPDALKYHRREITTAQSHIVVVHLETLEVQGFGRGAMGCGGRSARGTFSGRQGEL